MDVMSLYTNIPQEEGINIVCNAYEPIPQKRTSYPYTTAAKSAQTFPCGELLPVKWKKLPKNTWDCHGHQNGSYFRQYFHG